MTYEETKELEANIKIKNEAEETYNKFFNNIKLDPKAYKGEGRFVFWKDEHNAIYIRLKDDYFIFECRFLHESYNVIVTPDNLFWCIKNNYRGYEHLKSAVRDK